MRLACSSGNYEEAVEPDLETLRIPQARELGQRKQEGLLHRVLRPLDIPQDAVGDGKAAVAIEVDELGERILVAVTRPLDQRRTHRRSLSRWRPAWALHQVQMVAQAERFTDCLARVVARVVAQGHFERTASTTL